MKLQKLEICGFKSFADKTVVNFDHEGITGVVGPNGCGKSNIVDSMRWVMGEMSAKHLRGKSMEDVIFSGTQSRASTGRAEVTLTFNAQGGQVPAAYANFSEISITRRLYRSGESEYFINKSQCRLRDIQEFFLGTGVGTKAYSIIEQGKIGQILTAKPEERRLLLEEAAGISKFKSRKDSALRKIEATRQNLNRLADILGELERQKNTLERQAQKAQSYQEIFEELKDLELHLSSLDFLKASEDLSKAEKALQEIETQESALSAQVGELENKLESRRLVLLEKDREYLKAQEELYEKNNALGLSQAQVEYKSRESENLLRQSQKATEQAQLAKSRLETDQSQVKELNESKVAVDLEWAGTQERYANLEIELNLQLEETRNLKTQLETQAQKQLQLIQALSQAQHAGENLENQKVLNQQSLSKNLTEIEEGQNLLQANTAKQSQLEKSLGTLKQFKLQLVEESESLERELANKKQKTEKEAQALAELKEELSLKSSRLQSLEDFQQSLEGYQEGVRKVLGRPQGERDQVFGTVADFVETESTYEPAVTAALGEKLQYVVVQDQHVGVEALQYVKGESAGRLTCVPLALRSGSNEEPLPYGKEDGVLGPLKNFVGLPDNYDHLQDYLFSNTYLVENLNSALDIWSRNGHRKTLVTLEGEVVDPYGVVTGGASQNSSEALLKNKREIKELQSSVESLKLRWQEKSTVLKELQKQISHLELSLENLRQDSHGEALKVLEQEKDLNHLKAKNQELQQKIDYLKDQTKEAQAKETEYDQGLNNLKFQKETLEKDLQQAKTQEVALKEKLSEQEGQLESLRGQMLEAKSEHALVGEKHANLEKDLSRLVQAKEEAEQSLQSAQQEIRDAEQKREQLSQEIKEHQERIKTLVHEITQAESLLAQLKDRLSHIKGEIQEGELKIKQDRGNLDSLRSQLKGHLESLSQGRTQVQVLREQILERYQVDLSTVAPEYGGKEITVEEPRERAALLRRKIERLGRVNLAAMEEFTEVAERYTFLQKQHEDLELSLDNLLKALTRVNRNTKKRLAETFERVNALFQEVFPKLFKGGQAQLNLTDPENILESGVEMIAQPPGKKLQNVNLLSGGEKALTAISLVFAIFLLKPSPFCLLDEVDAPLDDANVDRFNDMVRSMTGRSQFILITHNKRTMEMADILYGVTMEQAGISKLVSVDLRD